MVEMCVRLELTDGLRRMDLISSAMCFKTFSLSCTMNSSCMQHCKDIAQGYKSLTPPPSMCECIKVGVC